VQKDGAIGSTSVTRSDSPKGSNVSSRILQYRLFGGVQVRTKGSGTEQNSASLLPYCLAQVPAGLHSLLFRWAASSWAESEQRNCCKRHT
jgi:hypothetical protein